MIAERMVLLTGLVLVAMACSPATPAERSIAEGGARSSSTGPKRLTAGVTIEPKVFYRPLIADQGQAGDLADLLTGGLTTVDHNGVRQRLLAADIPSLENGLWKLLPDGRMESIWKIRPGSTWHDGVPLTAKDLLFTIQLSQGQELPELRATVLDLVESVQAIDDQSVSVLWAKPYIWADRLFAAGLNGVAVPVPAHLLEPATLSNKEGLRDLPYWTDQYISLGPYRLRELERGSRVVLEAHRGYALGQPRIDEIEVRFVGDGNALTAGLLSGAIDMTLGTGMALEDALKVRDQWPNGSMLVNNSSWIVIFPQFINPNPAVIGDVRFRRALLHAIDREAMVAEIQAGMVTVADSYVSPNEPEFAETQGHAVRYAYDPRRAAQLLEELGYERLPDGGWRGGGGQRLGLELRTGNTPIIHTRTLFPVADFWQRLGIDVDPVVVPTQRVNDREYIATMPAARLSRYPNGAQNVERFSSAQTPLPENRFGGTNISRYINPAFDAEIDRYLITIPWTERMQILGRIVHRISDELIVMGLFYDVRTYMVSKRLANVTPAYNTTWNVREWDIR
jgi:peptide/nickel transport system substrate-binding protein